MGHICFFIFQCLLQSMLEAQSQIDFWGQIELIFSEEPEYLDEGAHDTGSSVESAFENDSTALRDEWEEIHSDIIEAEDGQEHAVPTETSVSRNLTNDAPKETFSSEDDIISEETGKVENCNTSTNNKNDGQVKNNTSVEKTDKNFKEKEGFIPKKTYPTPPPSPASGWRSNYYPKSGKDKSWRGGWPPDNRNFDHRNQMNRAMPWMPPSRSYPTNPNWSPNIFPMPADGKSWNQRGYPNAPPSPSYNPPRNTPWCSWPQRGRNYNPHPSGGWGQRPFGMSSYNDQQPPHDFNMPSQFAFPPRQSPPPMEDQYYGYNQYGWSPPNPSSWSKGTQNSRWQPESYPQRPQFRPRFGKY
ncbi:putative uncharacterized protein DDB_G0284695 [Centruroides sculpturatus]|uniref:putative uncharacterized protein DDB_G0284695 n=1 Tax=Centruroides sculpturatus TaxID=218467 RepID=UPI000C6E8B0E|nr:putative uncharacterized protein DDB_G0284695 [Centruroides sculpturatus]